MITKFLRVGWLLAFACTILAYPAVWGISTTATEAYFITPFDAKRVEINRGMFQLDEPNPASPDYPRKVMAIYGLPNAEPDRVVLVSQEKFLRPPELPSLTLLPVDKAKGENPLQEKTIYFLARWTVRGAGSAGLLLFLLWRVALRARRPPAASSP
jgi:hypothetical protein